jgi:hypothetical protein
VLVKYAGIKVLFYDGNKHVVGAAWGHVTNLPYGQVSPAVPVVGIAIPEFETWEPLIDNVDVESSRQ